MVEEVPTVPFCVVEVPVEAKGKSCLAGLALSTEMLRACALADLAPAASLTPTPVASILPSMRGCPSCGGEAPDRAGADVAGIDADGGV